MRIAWLAVIAVAFAGPALAADFDDTILAAHNAERAAVGVPPVTWSSTLAAHAATWAKHLAQLGTMQHSRPSERPGEGENLWAGTAGAYSAAEMVAGWTGEKKDFRNGDYPDVTRGGTVGHYTQMIWKTTNEIGCATARGGQYDILVCRYGPPGNMVGERPF
jgi:uncharacterized protein YkwD